MFAWVHAENSKVSVTDLSSTNGTYIDDEELVPLRAVEMSVGKEVTFGKGFGIFRLVPQLYTQSSFYTKCGAGDMFLAKFKLEERT